MNTKTFTVKPIIVSLAAVLALSSGLATADDEGRYGTSGGTSGGTYNTPAFQDRAKVISTTPVYDRINEPRRECHTDYQTYEGRSYRNNNNTGGAVLGAIVGGLVGSTVGKGNGKVAAAAVGAATGAVVGDRWNDRGDRYTTTETRPVENCRMVDHYNQRISGYDVTYRYQGKEFATRLPYDPGNWLTLNVSVSVAEDRPNRQRNEGRNRWYED